MTSINGITHNICNHLRSGLQTHTDVLFVLLFPCLKKNVLFVLLSVVDQNNNSDELGEGTGLGAGLGEGVEFIVVEFIVVEFVELAVVEFVEFIGDKFITESSTIGHDEVIGQDHSVTLCI